MMSDATRVPAPMGMSRTNGELPKEVMSSKASLTSTVEGSDVETDDAATSSGIGGKSMEGEAARGAALRAHGRRVGGCTTKPCTHARQTSPNHARMVTN